MKKMVMMMILCGALLMTEKGLAIDKKLLENSDPYHPYTGPVMDDVRIVFSGVYMPMGRFPLIRKKDEICTLKFTRFWIEKQGKEKEQYASYISYYQNDGSGNFLSHNVKITEGQASHLPLRGWSKFFWQPGKTYLKCGPLKLAWMYYGFVCACEKRGYPGDCEIELAPTPWENITEVNVSDNRIKWYRYDKNRKTIDIPVIDKLWDDKTGEK